MTVKLKSSDFELISEHAKKGLPNEACGLIAGSKSGSDIIVEKVYLLNNPDKSPRHFSIDPKEHLDAVKDMRKNGYRPLGNFHSHPESPARPSEEDIRLAFDPSAVYLIVSLLDTSPVIKAFKIENSAVESAELVLL
ncbi:Mov34/MPN/PAD-1 family protein [Clostridia bacterium]|nr:Mov34/MPN/PAD-1 family protein [Clostridia bacterium]